MSRPRAHIFTPGHGQIAHLCRRCWAPATAPIHHGGLAKTSVHPLDGQAQLWDSVYQTVQDANNKGEQHGN